MPCFVTEDGGGNVQIGRRRFVVGANGTERFSEEWREEPGAPWSKVLFRRGRDIPRAGGFARGLLGKSAIALLRRPGRVPGPAAASVGARLEPPARGMPRRLRPKAESGG